MDVKAILTELQIPYWTEGSNVPRGNVNIRCPHCNDRSNHGTINRNGYYRCWRCQATNLAKTLSIITNRPLSEIGAIIRRFNAGGYIAPPAPKANPNPIKTLPGGKLTQWHREYLYKRDYDPNHLEAKYHLQGTTMAGFWEGLDFSYRLIIPVYDAGGALATFLGRDITGSSFRYKNCPVEKSGQQNSIKNLLYNYHIANQYNWCIVCEGVFDAWRLDIPQAIATFGIELSQTQLSLLANFDIVIFAFDNEPQAQRKSSEYGARLRAGGSIVYNIAPIEGKDLGDYNHLECLEFMQAIREKVGI